MNNILDELKKKGEIPHYLTEEGFQTLNKGYLQKGETIRQAFERVAKSIICYGGYSKDIQDDLFYVTFEKGWAGYATPVLANSGTERALPISCYISSVEDSMESIMGEGIGELSMLSKMGGGVGVSFQKIRSAGTPIKGGLNGRADGVIPFAKVYDSAIMASKQPGVRRGSASLNLDIEHGDASDFISMRRPEGDINSQCLNLNHCVSISDSFMKKVVDGDKTSRQKWVALMKARIELGEPYILFTDTVNRANPKGYKDRSYNINYTNICSEILMNADSENTVVCCLSSLNLAKYDEWKDWKSPRTGMTLPQLFIYALDGVMEEFIQRGKSVPFLNKAVNGAKNGRGLGLGVMGYHTYLQKNMIPFESFKAMSINNEMFKFIKQEAAKASRELAISKGEPEWCRGTGMRNTHLLAIAPTKSNSSICSDTDTDTTPGIEPLTANAFLDVTSKGSFVRKNKLLIPILDKLGINDFKTWKSIERNNGSVQHLKELTEEQKQVFLTAYEINQKSLIQAAAQRQPYICQSQSLNLFFPHTVSPKYFSDVHILAWELGVKTLYYCKSTAGKVSGYTEDGECKACEG
jgi:ribonucleoside-diphosphate reductase alpha chain